MGVCQFFLKGNCKFGTYCRNEHPQGSSGTSFGGRNDRYHFNANNNVVKPSLFGSNSNNNKGGGLFGGSSNRTSGGGLFGNPNTEKKGGLFSSSSTNKGVLQQDAKSVLQLLRKELEEWERCKIWPLSCFAAQKEAKCISGLLDFSPEELRNEAYKAKETQSLEPYLSGLRDLSGQSLNRRNQLKSMSNEQLLQEVQSTASGFQQASGVQQSSGLFGTATQASSGLFGTQANQQSKGLFGTSATNNGGLFSSNQSTGLFGNSAGSASNPFASSNSSSTGLFGGASSGMSTGSSSFGSQNQGTSSGGLFSSSAGGTNTSGLFGGKPSTGGLFSSGTGSSATSSGGLFSSGMNSSSVFGSQTEQKQGGLFSSNAGSNVFGSGFNSNSGGFGSTAQPLSSTQPGQSGGLFSQRPASSIFSSNTSTSQVPQQQPTQSSNPFMTTKEKQQQADLQSLQQQTASQPVTVVSTKLPPLTEKDIAAYKADMFVLGLIPECPPPPELC